MLRWKIENIIVNNPLIRITRIHEYVHKYYLGDIKGILYFIFYRNRGVGTVKLPLHPLSLMNQVYRNIIPVVHKELAYWKEASRRNTE